MNKPRRCGTCRFLDVPPNKAGARAPIRDRAYKCTYIIPEIPLPDSVAIPLSYGGVKGTHDLSRHMMAADAGMDCQYLARPLVLRYLSYPQPELDNIEGPTSPNAGVASAQFDILFYVGMISGADLAAYITILAMFCVGKRLLGDADS